MRYKYECPQHGTEIRNVPVDDRDLQVCNCGAVMDRIFEATTNIGIPDRFTMDRGDLNAVTSAGKRRAAEAVPYERLPDNA